MGGIRHLSPIASPQHKTIFLAGFRQSNTSAFLATDMAINNIHGELSLRSNEIEVTSIVLLAHIERFDSQKPILKEWVNVYA